MQNKSIKGGIVGLMLLVSILFPPFVPAAEIQVLQDNFIELTVSRGDCLINLSRDYLKRPGLWQEIARLNKLSNPHRIYPGQRLRIPLDYMKGTPVEGRLRFFKGAVFVSGPGVTPESPAKRHQSLSEGQTIRTGPKGVAEIAYADGIRVMVRPKSRVSIVQSQIVHQKVWLHRIYTSIGRVISHVRKATGYAPRFEIKTPSAVALARGTDFRITQDHLANLRCEVLEGSVGVATPQTQVLVKQGQGTWVPFGGPPTVPRSLPLPPQNVRIDKGPTPLSVRLDFQPAEQATQYRALISRDKAATEIVRDAQIIQAPPFDIQGLSEGDYFVRLFSVDQDGLQGRASATHAFSIQHPPPPPKVTPPPPLPSAPELTDVQIHKRNFHARWEAAQGQLHYDYQIAADQGFETIINADKTDQTHISVTELVPGDYFFRVRAIDQAGRPGTFSTPQQITIKTPYTLLPIGTAVLIMMLLL